MTLFILTLLTAISVSLVAAYFSIAGLIAIFATAPIPIAIMGGTLEAAKLVAASWVYRNWALAPRALKYYLTAAVVILSIITSMGIFGYLSKAHIDQNLVSGDVQAKLAIFDEKIKTAKENIDVSRKQLKQMDEAVDQVMTRSTSEQGADKAVALRRTQAKERTQLLKEIEANQKIITALNEEAAPIRAEIRKVEAEVGPVKYIANFIYGETEQALLEKAVTWIIILIVVVFDPLAILLLIAANITLKQTKGEIITPVEKPSDKFTNFFESTPAAAASPEWSADMYRPVNPDIPKDVRSSLP